MQAEEAMLDLPVIQKVLTLFKEIGDPTIANMGIEGRKHVINHPEDGLATFGLTEIVASSSVVHLVNSQVSCVDERLKEVEVISTASVNHRH